MKVLLCTPYNIGPKLVYGGLVVWARYIIDYYNTTSKKINVQVVSFDRKVSSITMTTKLSIKRVWQGFSDYIKPIKETRRQLNKEQYDVLHLCTSASIGLLKDILILRMAKRKSVKTVIHFHFGRIPELAQQRNWEWKFLQKVMRLADTAITMDMKSCTALKGCGYGNVCFLPNPISQGIMRQIEIDAATTVREERKLCFVGHVIPTKGVYELVEACKDIKNVRLHVLGKASLEVQEKMRELADDGDWLVFEGEVAHQQVIRELLTTDIFVLPTYTEGFPNVILESMACGCAIATTPVGAIPEMLDIESDEPCGLCCEPKDVEGLRRNIQYFLDHPDEARKYGERAMERVNDMYAIPIIWERLVRIWKDCSEKAIKQEGPLC